jgi:EAL domain-containing protein (putative c-di-GMP-specific phosphodiesterase class I)
MIKRTHRKVFPPGAEICREGEPGDRAYLIERGLVEISVLRGGRKEVIATLGPGEMFGEMTLIDEKVRSATVIAVEESDAVVITRDQIRRRMAKADPLLNTVLRVVLERFRSEQWRRRQPSTAGVSADEAHDHYFERDRKRAIDILNFEDELTAALRKQELELHYQPIVRLADNRLAGFEALVRWRHPRRGLLWPNDFLPLAEESRLIIPLGLWAMETACEALHAFQSACGARRKGAERLFVHTNFSSTHLMDPALVRQIAERAGHSRIDPDQMVLEITETELMADPDRAATTLHEIREFGFKIAIDDFGTGYSSLSYLNRFPIDTLKIDRSFINTMARDRHSRVIVHSLTTLAHDLGMSVVAEGVESKRELSRLKEFGCDYGQGFLLSEPLPRAEVQAKLLNR